MRGLLTIGATFVLVAGCAGNVMPSATVAVPSPTSATASPSGTAPASPLGEAPSGELASAVYPFVLSWPAGDVKSSWRTATKVWDGMARIDHGNAYTDSVRTTDGDLFAFGYPTDASVDDVEHLVAEQAATWHGCEAEPLEKVPLAAGDSEGVLATYNCEAIRVLRWIGTHDGFGLFVGLIVASDTDPDEARARFADRISELRWTS